MMLRSLLLALVLGGLGIQSAHADSRDRWERLQEKRELRREDRLTNSLTHQRYADDGSNDDDRRQRREERRNERREERGGDDNGSGYEPPRERRINASEAARIAQDRNGGGRVLDVMATSDGWRVKLVKAGEVRTVLVSAY